jgi:hypothetical protein
MEHHIQLRHRHHQITKLEDEVRVLAEGKLNINHGHEELLHITIAAHDLELKPSVQDAKETEQKKC